MHFDGPHLSVSRRGLLSGAMLLAGAPLAAAVPGPAPSWVLYGGRLTARLEDAGGGSFELDLARGLLLETNRFRASLGLGLLDWDEGLALSARAHAADMVARGFFDHQSPDGFSHIDRISILNRDFCGQTAENLAFRSNPNSPTRPRHIQALWEASPQHRENVCNADFHAAGFGVVRTARTVYVAGLYGDAAVRLGQRLPFVVNTRRDLEPAIVTATPDIDLLSVTAPRSRATWMIQRGETLPELYPGMWQLRPLKVLADNKYLVLPGPLFHLAG